MKKCTERKIFFYLILIAAGMWTGLLMQFFGYSSSSWQYWFGCFFIGGLIGWFFSEKIL